MAITDAQWDEIRRVRDHQQELATQHLGLKGEVDEICMRVERVEGDMKHVATKADLNHVEQMVSQKIDYLKDTFDPLKKGLYALVWLVISAVILGGLAFLINRPTPPTP